MDPELMKLLMAYQQGMRPQTITPEGAMGPGPIGREGDPALGTPGGPAGPAGAPPGGAAGRGGQSFGPTAQMPMLAAMFNDNGGGMNSLYAGFSRRGAPGVNSAIMNDPKMLGQLTRNMNADNWLQPGATQPTMGKIASMGGSPMGGMNKMMGGA